MRWCPEASLHHPGFFKAKESTCSGLKTLDQLQAKGNYKVDTRLLPDHQRRLATAAACLSQVPEGSGAAHKSSSAAWLSSHQYH